MARMQWRSGWLAGARTGEFRLLRSFALWSFPCIAVIGAVTAYLHRSLEIENILAMDRRVAMETIQALADVEDAGFDFSRPEIIASEYGMSEFFMHLSTMPDAIWVRVYRRDQMVVWSNDPYVVGRQLGKNRDLARALSGQAVSSYSNAGEHDKEEFKFAAGEVDELVEHYLPVWNAERDRILGVVEIYKNPDALLVDLNTATQSVWLIHAATGVALYGMMLLIVWRIAAALGRHQQFKTEVVASAAVGEMAVGMAHIIRNPLASIRSSAELALEEAPGEAVAETSEDIIAEVDRLEQTMRELLLLTRSEREGQDRVHIGELVRCSLSRVADIVAARDIKVSLDLREPLPPVVGDASGLQMALNKLVSNVVSGVKNGAPLTIAVGSAKDGELIELTIENGEDILSEVLADGGLRLDGKRKSAGFNLGDSLIRRVVERHGGRIARSGAPGGPAGIAVYLPKGVH